jgi:transaldolase
MSSADLKVKVFADGADLAGITELYRNPIISGFTTNPTLMRQAGIDDYESFARAVLDAVPDRPISFEVFSDDWDEMERQAAKIASWGPNVYVKIPVTNTSGDEASKLIRRLAEQQVQLNVTALMTLGQVAWVADAAAASPSSYVSVFAGRIADTGRDPVPLMAAAVELLRPYPQLELIWASPREILNVVQADQIGCHVITVTHDLLKKLDLFGKDLDDYSLDTVKMFHRDASAAGFQL